MALASTSSFAGSGAGVPPVGTGDAPCPKCGAALPDPVDAGASGQTDRKGSTGPTATWSCNACGWKGRGWRYVPPPPEATRFEDALPDAAACAHHPAKRAVAICEGTGDFICDLCEVKIDGRSYGAAYLQGGGQALAEQRFASRLPRPDATVVTFCLLCFLPYVSCVWYLGWIAWFPFALYHLQRAYRLRRTDPLYAAVVSRGRLVFVSLLLLLVCGVIPMAIIAFFTGAALSGGEFGF